MSTTPKQFDPISQEEWWKVIHKELKGKPEETVFTKWFEGLETPPFHSWEKERPTEPLFSSYQWHASESAGPKNLSKNALKVLNLGADGLRLNISDSSNLDKDLKEIQLDFLRTEICPSNVEGTWLNLWEKTLADQSIDRSKLNAGLGFDLFAGAYQSNISEEEFLANLKALAPIADNQLFRHTYLVDTSRFENAGGRIDTQLGIALAMSYEMIYKGDIKDANRFHFRFALSRSFLAEIAKLRAFRVLWNQLVSELDLAPSEAFINVMNSDRPLSSVDPHINLLRLTTMAVSGVLGGAQNVELKHHSPGQDLPKEAHLPLNILHLIRFEGRLDQIEDPLAGSYSIEAMTQEIANLGWEAFKAIEQQGGIIEAINSGWLANRIEEEAQEEQNRFDDGHSPIIGSSIYPYKLQAIDKPLEESLTGNFPLRRLASEKENSQNS